MARSRRAPTPAPQPDPAAIDAVIARARAGRDVYSGGSGVWAFVWINDQVWCSDCLNLEGLYAALRAIPHVRDVRVNVD
jgi:hypothetical protein